MMSLSLWILSMTNKKKSTKAIARSLTESRKILMPGRCRSSREKKASSTRHAMEPIIRVALKWLRGHHQTFYTWLSSILYKNNVTIDQTKETPNITKKISSVAIRKSYKTISKFIKASRRFFRIISALAITIGKHTKLSSNNSLRNRRSWPMANFWNTLKAIARTNWNVQPSAATKFSRVWKNWGTI